SATVKHLLSENPTLDPSVNKNKALGIAVSQGYLTLVKLLLTDPRVKPSYKIVRAAEKGHVEILKVLLAFPNAYMIGNEYHQDTRVRAINAAIPMDFKPNKDQITCIKLLLADIHVKLTREIIQYLLSALTNFENDEDAFDILTLLFNNSSWS